MLILVMTALASPVPQLTYLGPSVRAGTEGPRWTGKAHATVTEVTHYEAGAKVFVATANANLREAASTDAAVITRLPLGTPVKVIGRLGALSEPVVVSERVDHWYEVQAGDSKGYLFGGTLTPLAFRADLDGEPGDEVLTVAWRWDFALQIRVGPADGRSEVVETMTLGGDRKGGVAYASLLPPGVSGVPTVLLYVDLGGWEMTEGTTWVHAFRAKAGAPVERLSSYFHNYDSGVIGTLRFDGKGTVCSAFTSSKSSDRCVGLEEGESRAPAAAATLKSWARFPPTLWFEND